MAHGNFRVGVIGAGGVARGYHLPGWNAIPGVQVAAIADINKAAASALAMEYGIPHVFTDYREMLALDLDAVDVCIPNMAHTEAVKASLEAGKHVICEKPLAVTAREVREMGTLADHKGLKLMTAQHHRFGSMGRAARQWAAAGFLGPVYHARALAMRRATLPVSPGFIDASLSGGGPCMDIAVHALDICLWLMGFPEPELVSGVARVNFAKGTGIPGMWGEWNRDLFSVEDFAAGFVRFRDQDGTGGATLVLETAWLGHQAEEEDMSCRLFGLKGGLQWPQGDYATVQAGVFAQGTLKHPVKVEKPHTEALRAFRDCVVKGGPSPVPWRETLKVIAILEAIYRSQAEGKEVRIDPDGSARER